MLTFSGLGGLRASFLEASGLHDTNLNTDINNFYIAISKITKEFLLKGFNKCILFKYFLKFVCQYEFVNMSYNMVQIWCSTSASHYFQN